MENQNQADNNSDNQHQENHEETNIQNVPQQQEEVLTVESQSDQQKPIIDSYENNEQSNEEKKDSEKKQLVLEESQNQNEQKPQEIQKKEEKTQEIQKKEEKTQELQINEEKLEEIKQKEELKVDTKEEVKANGHVNEVDVPLKLEDGDKWVKLANEVFEIINKIRKEPKSFVGHLQKLQKRFKGNKLFQADQTVLQKSKDKKEPEAAFVMTKEGEKAVVEAIKFLEQQKPLKPLKFCDELASAAKDHVANGVGKPEQYIAKYGRIDSTWAESTIYGSANAKEIIERLIVSDGQVQRGFRLSLFNEDLKIVGIAVGSHNQTMASLLYATKWLKEGEEPTAKKITDKSLKPTPKERDSTGPADKTKKPLRPQTARVVPTIKPTEDKKEPEAKPRQSLKPPAQPKVVIPKTGMKSVMGKQEEEKKSEKNDVRPSTAKPSKYTTDPKNQSKPSIVTKKPEEEKKEEKKDEKKKPEEKKTPLVVKPKAPLKIDPKTDTKTQEKKITDTKPDVKTETKATPKIETKKDITKPTLKPVPSRNLLTEQKSVNKLEKSIPKTQKKQEEKKIEENKKSVEEEKKEEQKVQKLQEDLGVDDLERTNTIKMSAIVGVEHGQEPTQVDL